MDKTLEQSMIKDLDFETTNAALFDFLDRSPVPFFAVRNMKEALEAAGFVQLQEHEHWEIFGKVLWSIHQPKARRW